LGPGAARLIDVKICVIHGKTAHWGDWVDYSHAQ
jgi:hypothetical protein